MPLERNHPSVLNSSTTSIGESRECTPKSSWPKEWRVHFRWMFGEPVAKKDMLVSEIVADPWIIILLKIPWEMTEHLGSSGLIFFMDI